MNRDKLIESIILALNENGIVWFGTYGEPVGIKIEDSKVTFIADDILNGFADVIQSLVKLKHHYKDDLEKLDYELKEHKEYCDSERYKTIELSQSLLSGALKDIENILDQC